MSGSQANTYSRPCSPPDCSCCIDGACRSYPSCNLLEFTLLIICGVIVLLLAALFIWICYRKKKQNQVGMLLTHARRNLERRDLTQAINRNVASHRSHRDGTLSPPGIMNSFELDDSGQASSFHATARNQELSSTINQDGTVVYKRRVIKGVPERDIPLSVQYHPVPQKLYKLPTEKLSSGIAIKGIIVLNLQKTKPDASLKHNIKSKAPVKSDADGTVESESGIIKNLIVPSASYSSTPRKGQRPGSSGNDGSSDRRHHEHLSKSHIPKTGSISIPSGRLINNPKSDSPAEESEGIKYIGLPNQEGSFMNLYPAK